MKNLFDKFRNAAVDDDIDYAAQHYGTARALHNVDRFGLRSELEKLLGPKGQELMMKMANKDKKVANQARKAMSKTINKLSKSRSAHIRELGKQLSKNLSIGMAGQAASGGSAAPSSNKTVIKRKDKGNTKPTNNKPSGGGINV